jgi:small subunit ribosomal protein S6
LKTAINKLYEGMFLVDSAQAASDWEGVQKTIANILKRAEAEIVVLRKWDERRLAYEIDRQSRGTYILCYFRADGQRIRSIERAVQLSDNIMRVLILCAEAREQEDIEKETSAVMADETAQEPPRVVPEAAGEQLPAPDESEAVKKEHGDADTAEGRGPAADEPLAEQSQESEES